MPSSEAHPPLTRFRPVSYTYISQYFGEADACINPDTGRVISKKTEAECQPPYINLYTDWANMAGHNATDRPVPMRVGVYHPYNFPGWYRLDDDSHGGLGVDIVSYKPLLQCNEPGCNEKHYVKWRSWHHAERPRDTEQRISTGGLVALAGNTGNSSGPHVHEGLLWSAEDGRGIHKDNGYRGAIDERAHPDIKYVESVFVLDYINVKSTIAKASLPKDALFHITQLVKSFD